METLKDIKRQLKQKSKELEFELSFQIQFLQAKLIANTLGHTEKRIILTHGHHCIYCELTWNCQEDCNDSYEVKRHECGERERWIRLMRKFKYGCDKLPCVHDKWPMLEGKKQRYANEFMRPAIVFLDGKPVVASVENPVSIAKYHQKIKLQAIEDKINAIKQAITDLAKDDLSNEYHT